MVRRCDRKGLNSRYHSVETGSDLLAAFYQIKEEVKSNKTYPYIHLECHGNDDGICLKNDFRLTWENLSELTTEINGLAGNNLVISMALCYGGHFNVTLINSLNASEVSRAPALAIIGPEKGISFGQLESGFSYFFDTFLTTRNLDLAVKSLNIHSNYEGKYIYHTCEAMYKSLMEYFIKTSVESRFTSNEQFEKEINKILKGYQLQTGQKVTRKQVSLLRQKMLEKNTYMEQVDEMRNTYYWIDKFPSNEYRFGKFDITNWEEITERFK